MPLSGKKKFYKVYPVCRSTVDSDTWDRIIAQCGKDQKPETLPNRLALQMGSLGVPGFLPELARLEWTVYDVAAKKIEIQSDIDQIGINPTLELLQLSWKNLSSLVNSNDYESLPIPEPGEEFVMVWGDPKAGKPKVQAASHEDLLVLKVVVEGIDPKEVAAEGSLPVGAVDAAIHRAVSKGILLAPSSRIRRDANTFSVGENTDGRFLTSAVFTLQWHITQACDLHCKHCYDRSNRSPLKLDQGLRILDDLRDFCQDRHVRGQVSFTGGNPLLHPQFVELYRAATQRGLGVAVLGNPAPKKDIEELLAVQQPVFFQVSLEGLREHNDMIRGSGHFDRVMEFLSILRDLGVPSKVMLTLTAGNIDQVVPLGEMLRDLTDDFTFNRLSMVGEGANLRLPLQEDFVTFLAAYMEAAKRNPVIGLKDNLINIIRHQGGIEPFGGCTGYGCGAAFNFMAVLSDGQAHACRKFPSPIGNVFEQSIAEIYDSEIADQYRAGPASCRSCPIHLVCRGCLAVAYSHGLNVFEQRDPYCFMTLS